MRSDRSQELKSVIINSRSPERNRLISQGKLRNLLFEMDEKLPQARGRHNDKLSKRGAFTHRAQRLKLPNRAATSCAVENELHNESEVLDDPEALDSMVNNIPEFGVAVKHGRGGRPQPLTKDTP